MFSSPRSLLSAFVVLSVLALGGVAHADAAVNPALVDACRADLAQRLHVGATQITLEKLTPVTWQNTALGLPEPDKLYAMMLVPGYEATLHSPLGSYRYHLSQKNFKYAGREEMWGYSALYLEPIENDPNLNGTLMQVSLLGTNPFPLATGVSDFFPQADGSVLATRRTSRSGFDLLWVTPQKTKVIASAFDFAYPLMATEGGPWLGRADYVVFYRAMVGGPWEVETGSFRGGVQPNSPLLPSPNALPDLPVQGQPYRLLWERNRGPQFASVAGDGVATPEAILRTDQGLKAFKLVDNNGAKAWEATTVPPETPGKFSLMVNKSNSLVVETAMTAATPPHPVTRVYNENFLGDQTPIASLDNFSMTQVEVSPDLQYALVVGQQGDTQKAYTVDLYAGEVFPTILDAKGPIHLSGPAHAETTLAPQ